MEFRQRIEKCGYCSIELNGTHLIENKTPITIDYNVIALCDSGEVTFEVNMQKVTMRKGECACLGNVVFIHTTNMSPDFKARVIVCSRAFSLDTIVGIPTEYLELVFFNPSVKIETDVEWQLLSNFFDNMILLQDLDLGAKHAEVTGATFRSIIMVIAQHEVRMKKFTHKKISYSQSDAYFRNFIALIQEHIKQEHEVSFYASKLNITPKYLSLLCKQKSGYKAKDVISAFLASKLKQELILSGKSAKQLSYEYGFADQSSMGKFFNKATGMSPTEFKSNYL